MAQQSVLSIRRAHFGCVLLWYGGIYIKRVQGGAGSMGMLGKTVWHVPSYGLDNRARLSKSDGQLWTMASVRKLQSCKASLNGRLPLFRPVLVWSLNCDRYGTSQPLSLYFKEAINSRSRMRLFKLKPNINQHMRLLYTQLFCTKSSKADFQNPTKLTAAFRWYY